MTPSFMIHSILDFLNLLIYFYSQIKLCGLKCYPNTSIKVPTTNISNDQAWILAVDLLVDKVLGLKKTATDLGYKVAFKEHIETNYN